MSQRNSGYERKERDLYETPEWVTQALLRHVRGDVVSIWEPAAGTGKMARVLAVDHDVYSSDIDQGYDFLTASRPGNFDAIITNPPYDLAEEFIGQAIMATQPGGLVAMLLRTDYDHAQTRRYLFNNERIFSKKIVLTKRIRWFEDSKGSPSFNHAWFIWDWRHSGPPTLAYGP